MELRRLIVFLVAAVLLPSLTAGDSAPKNDLVKVQTWVDGIKNSEFVGVGTRFGAKIPSKEKNAYLFALTRSDPHDGCNSPKNKLANDVIMVHRGNCASTTKANNAEAAGASAVLIINNEKDMYNMVCDQDETDLDIHIPVVMLPQEAGLSLMKLLSNSSSVSVQLYSPKHPLVDIADVLVRLMAIVTILCASYWSAWTASEAARDAAIEQDKPPKDPEGKVLNGSMQDIAISTTFAIIFVLVAASCFLVILYKLISSWDPNLLLVVLFFILGATCLEICLIALLSRWFKSSAESYIKVPVFGVTSHLTLVVSPFCMAFAALWGVYHHLSFAWIGQDILGIAFLITVLRMGRIPNLKVGLVFLSCTFFYDILLMFAVNKLFHECVVIVDLVAGGGISGVERIPMILKLPRLFDPWGGNSFVLFDDLLVPGLVAAFSLRYDWKANKNLRAGYFLWVMFAYGLGLVITYVAEKMMDGPRQPALLYIAPLTLGVFLALGKKRGDLKALWTMGDQGRSDQTFLWIRVPRT